MWTVTVASPRAFSFRRTAVCRARENWVACWSPTGTAVRAHGWLRAVGSGCRRRTEETTRRRAPADGRLGARVVAQIGCAHGAARVAVRVRLQVTRRFGGGTDAIPLDRPTQTGGDRRLAKPWPVRGGYRSLDQAAGHSAASAGGGCPQRLAGPGRPSPVVPSHGMWLRLSHIARRADMPLPPSLRGHAGRRHGGSMSRQGLCNLACPPLGGKGAASPASALGVVRGDITVGRSAPYKPESRSVRRAPLSQKDSAIRAGEVVARGRRLGAKAPGNPFAKIRIKWHRTPRH